MGYEIKFKFYKKKTEGFGYDTESEPEVMSVGVGKQWDDVDLDEVAKAVFGQMAKRNILIVDAEVFEYTKKKVNFKLKDDGISIKNRKFSYDITGAIKSESEEAQTQIQVVDIPNQPVVQNGRVLQPHELLQQQLNQPQVQQQIVAVPNQPDISNLPPEVQAEIRQMQKVQQKVNAPAERMRPILPPPGQPIRYEVYDPHPQLAAAAKAQKMAFTIGKKYPIYEEKPDRRGVMFGMVYLTEDDNGNRRALNDKHFVPLQTLSNNFESDARPNHLSHMAVESNQAVVNGKMMNLPDIYTLGNRRR